jgi:hypothetical protein
MKLNQIIQNLQPDRSRKGTCPVVAAKMMILNNAQLNNRIYKYQNLTGRKTRQERGVDISKWSECI